MIVLEVQLVNPGGRCRDTEEEEEGEVSEGCQLETRNADRKMRDQTGEEVVHTAPEIRTSSRAGTFRALTSVTHMKSDFTENRVTVSIMSVQTLITS